MRDVLFQKMPFSLDNNNIFYLYIATDPVIIVRGTLQLVVPMYRQQQWTNKLSFSKTTVRKILELRI